ncbi:DUF4870 domain-containing protein [Rothia terrae]|uniref:DUF4870 domain-containing protein n=1 Tax=Rothia terrae TaxID=396015 RepID=UPI001D142473|nr:DUF4870 domain-containing protein [Rothia terrae]MDT0188813.1 DUF4870 domain-containing protein [Rothia terrae]
MNTATKIPSDSQFEGTHAAAGNLSVSEDRNIATLAHFSGVLGCVPSAVIYYLYKGRGPFTQQESREALNFTLLPTIVLVVSFALCTVPDVGGFFGMLAALIWAYLAVMSLVGGIKVNKGNPYLYPMNTRLFDMISRKK